ncbi:hypothetical protein RQP46_006440 [Phenoliferia psychrophenolica]
MRGRTFTTLALATSVSLSHAATSKTPIHSPSDALAQFAPLLPASLLATLQNALISLPVPLPALTGLPIRSLLDPFNSALAAAKLAGSQSNAAVLNDVQSCVNAVKAAATVPPGSYCVDAGNNSASAYGTAFDTMLEQFGGIMPPKTMEEIQAKTTPFFLSLGLIPPANDLNRRLNDAMTSTTASTSGNMVTAIESLHSCFTRATSGASLDANMACINGPSSAFVALNTLFAGVVQQFVGVFPPTATVDIINIYTYYFSMTGFTPGIELMKAMNPSIESVGASTAGSTQNFIIQMQHCFMNLVMSPDPSDVECTVGKQGPILGMTNAVNGVIQQFFGVLPPKVVLQLQKELAPMLATEDPSGTGIATAYQKTFAAANLGPSFVTCVEGLEGCIVAAVYSSVSECAAVKDNCTPLTNV